MKEKQNPNREKPMHQNPVAPGKNPQKEQEKKFRQGDRSSGCGC